MRRAVRTETWEEYRQRMLDETARFIEWGLHHPEEVIEIPMKPVSQGGFPPEVGRWFWTTVLTEHATAGILRWREFLVRRPRNLWQKVWGSRR
jgi:hypothetical protein